MDKKLLYSAFFLFYILSIVIYFIFPYNETRIFLQYSVLLSSLAIALTGGIYALKEYGLNSAKSKTLIFFTTGIGCWLIGESLWTYYEYILHTDPFPSIADIFYVSAYPLFFMGLVREIQSAKVSWHKLQKSILFLMLMSTVLLAIVVNYFGVFLAYSPQEPLLTNVIAMSYGIGDLILLVAAMSLLILAWEFRGGALSQIWLKVFFSFMFTLAADILFAIFTASYNETNSLTRSFIDCLWIVSYLLMGYALFSFAISIQSAHTYLQDLKKIKRPQHNN